MPRLAPTRSLLNPKFESYKLSFSPSPILRQFSLPRPVSQARSGLGAIGFQKVASRVRHNHLAVGNDIGVFVAENGTVYSINVDNSDSSPFHEIFQLPEFISDPKRTQGEYPAVAHVLSDIWFLSDGHGGAYLVRVSSQYDGAPAQPLNSFEFILDNETIPTPFQLHGVSVIDSGAAVAIVSTSVPHAKPPTTQAKAEDQHLFDIWGLRFSVPDLQSMQVDTIPSSEGETGRNAYEIVFRKRGTHIPFDTRYFPSVRSFLLLSGSTYASLGSALPTQEYVPTPDEYAPIPRLGDIAEGSFDLNSSSSATSIPPPYSWTQTDDSVTIAFALPGTTSKESIRVLFGKNAISLAIASDPPLGQPFYNNAPLWDEIDSASSIWTWERPPNAPSDADDGGSKPKAGLLTLHLEKTNEKTRWSSLFAQGFEAAEVPETLDPSQLAHIREMLDKYTATIKDGGGGGDFGHGVPSLVEGERDADVDEAVGKRTLCTWVNLNNDTPTFKPPVDDTPAMVLSLPMPVSNSPSSSVVDSDPPFGIIAKHDIDGPLYTLGFSTGSDGASVSPTWTHVRTYPALSFVLASKQDTRFTYHYQRSNTTLTSTNETDGVVLAFESGSRSSGSANIYTYHSSKRGDKQTRQSVFQMRPGSGALVGIGVVHSGQSGGEPVLICLCEKEVTLCRGVF